MFAWILVRSMLREEKKSTLFVDESAECFGAMYKQN
jgi:hypothetical protein